MTKPMQLIDVCGTCLADAVLLACPKAEWTGATGAVSANARTLLFQLAGGNPKYFGLLPFPVRNGWRSGHATYLSTASDHIYVIEGEDWTAPRRETVFAGESTDWGIWGVAGSDATHDTVWVGGRDCVYMRRMGAWERVPAAKGAGRLNRGHGRRPDELYVGSSLGLLQWNGSDLAAIESPDEGPVRAVHVVSDQELVAAATSALFRWQDTRGWSPLRSSFTSPSNFAALRGDVFTADWQGGVLKIDGSDLQQVAAVDSCLALVELTDGIVAKSADSPTHAFYDGTQWRELVVPVCLPGATP